jgi:fructokinase
MKVLSFGEILWDIIDGKKHLGGAPLNFAAHVVQCGGYAGMVSAVGEDELGRKAIEKVVSLNVDTNLVQRIEHKATGTVIVSTKNGQPDYEIITDVAYDFIDLTAFRHEEILKYNVFYFGSLIQRNVQSRTALFHILDNYDFDFIFYDINMRKDCYSKSHIEKSLGYCTILKMNDEEVDELGPLLFQKEYSFAELSLKLKKRYPQINIMIMTAGAKGSHIFENGKFLFVESQPVQVKNAVGAGDAFGAAFLTSYYKSKNSIQSGAFANSIGGFVATSSEPIPSYSDKIKELF